MHVGTGFTRLRNAVDRAHRLPIHEDNPLIPGGNGRKELLHDQRLKIDRRKELMQGREVAVLPVKPENARAAVAIKRLQDHIAVLFFEGPDGLKIPCDHRRRRQFGEAQNQELFGEIAHPERVIHNQRARVDHLQQMGRRDIAHVERRVLAQPNNIVFRQIDFGFLPIADVIAFLAAQRDREPPRNDPAFAKGKLIRSVEKQRVTTVLRFNSDPERTVCVNIDRSDRIHLQGNFQAHRIPLFKLPLSWRKAEPYATCVVTCGSCRQSVVEDFDATKNIHQGNINTTGCHLAGRFAPQVIRRRSENPPDLSRCDPFRRLSMTSRLFDLNKDEFVLVPQDQIDFPKRSAPALRKYRMAGILIVARNCPFCRPPGMIGHTSADLSLLHCFASPYCFRTSMPRIP